MDKVLLVTGASSDVGIKLVEKIYTNYSTIYLHYVHMNTELHDLIERIGDEKRIIPICADFQTENGIEELISLIKKQGLSPNNIVHLPAPKIHNTHFHKEPWQEYESGWNISVRSIVEITKAFLPSMTKSRYGRIVLMLTSNTIGNPPKYQSSYVTIKYALLGLMKSLAVEYIEKGITVNGVSPDMMETKFLSEIPNLIVEQNAMNNPLKRNIQVNEIIPVFELLLADNSAAITGQNIVVSGWKM